MFANETFRGKTTNQVAITQNKNSFQFAGPKITAKYNVAILRMHSRSFYGDTLFEDFCSTPNQLNYIHPRLTIF